MGMLNADLEIGIDRGSLNDTTEKIKEEVSSSGAETLDLKASGMSRMSDRIQNSVSEGFLSGIEDSALDTVIGSVVGGAAGAALPGRLGPPGAAAGATKGASEGMSGLGEKAQSVLGKAGPVGATLGVIAGGVTQIARNTGPLGSILDLFGTAVELALLPINQAIATYLQPLAMSAINLSSDFSTAMQGKGIGVVLGKTSSKALNFINNHLDTATGLLQNVGLFVWNALPSWYRSGLLTLWSGVKKAWKFLGKLFNVFTSFVNDPIGTIRTQISNLTTWFNNQGKTLLNRVEKDLPTIASAVSAVATGIDIVAGFLKNMSGESVKSIGAGAVGAGAGLLLGGPVGSAIGGTIGAGVGSMLPSLASGGVVQQETLARVGEAGPEAVVPLDQFNKVVDVEVTVDFDATNVESKLDTMIRLLKEISNQDPVEIKSEPGRDRGDKLL